MGKDYNIAKKTTQDEILAAVGNVAQQEEVQEILGKVNNGLGGKDIITHGGSCKSSTSGTFLEVNGSGNLLWTGFDHSLIKNGGTCKFTVEIDGEIVLDTTLKNSAGSNCPQVIALFHPSHGVPYSLSYLVGGDYSVSVPWTSTNKTLNIGSHNFTVDSSYNYYCLIEQQCLRFNESLKISYSNSANSSIIVAGYTLDE